MILYHGTTHTEFPRHVGLCLCETAETASHYAGPSGTVYEVEIDEDALDWVTVEGYDRETNVAPADRDPAALAAEHGVESVWFADEDPHQRAHDTLRLLTTAAVAAIVDARAVEA